MIGKALISKILVGAGSLLLVGSLASSAAPSKESTNNDRQPTVQEQIEPESPEQSVTKEEPVKKQVEIPAEVAKPVTVAREEYVEEAIAFETVRQDDSDLNAGTEQIIQNGVNGTKRTTYSVTYTDGEETGRSVKSVSTVKIPVNKVISVGTKIDTPPPAPAGSGYINVDGNYVQSPTYSDSVPAGASAQCNDGTYSFSQNRRGTCSGHGGVATWL